MKVLIINSGSSSIKYQIIKMPSQNVICSGIVERIGSEEAIIKYHTDLVNLKKIGAVKDHKIGLEKIVEFLLDSKNGVLKDTDEIKLVGHRVVHGGNSYANTTLITKEVREKIKEYSVLAPLHNPHNLEGILLSEQIFKAAKQVAVFDTAFHQTIPVKAKKYAIPNNLYEIEGIQIYGFHGTSHKYVSERAIAFLNKQHSKIISIHLGNGCSITAIENGKSVDHSLGFAPDNGLIMGSRSGDIDHGIIFYMVNNLGYDLIAVNEMLNKKSGMLGLTGFSDLRDIELAASKGNEACNLALDMNAYRIRKYIGAYVAAMNGVDALIFTAGIGENSVELRKRVCTNLEYLGIQLDDKKNNIKSNSFREINKSSANVKILVIPTDEELEIAKQVYEFQGNKN
jgi:acetate kinase